MGSRIFLFFLIGIMMWGIFVRTGKVRKVYVWPASDIRALSKEEMQDICGAEVVWVVFNSFAPGFGESTEHAQQGEQRRRDFDQLAKDYGFRDTREMGQACAQAFYKYGRPQFRKLW
ncbi:MAG: hypothetical protein Q8Q08_00700 [Candidatus Omnitrophota bacterium]|nr:hypothetical protein [Candidatus Omnitrophota bacterium]MDZ4242493.1 hypothetical protein [Candidatus Omnitrophota bacterium]